MSYPDLSTILEVYPECETTCYGYAPSQRRRCRMRTRKDNRDRASYILKEGTRFLQHGLPVDGLLIELAPLVLCTRFHQYQADDLVRDWRAKLRAFQQQTLLTAMLKSLQELVDSRARSLAAGSAGQRLSERALSPTRLERSAAIVTEEEPAAIDREEEEEEREDREDVPEPEPEPELSPSRTSTEASSPAVESHVAEPTIPQSEPRRTTRKPIEGDCDICLCPLRGQDSDKDGERSEDSDDENDNVVPDTASDNEHDENAEDNLDDLVYCKNQCGTNYHKACIDVWLATQRTFRTPRGDPIGLSCPNCRAAWSS
ncbi:uncharacterized protein NFIA_050180 [Aspergillus fischeri NRRL 181]|uniref:RING-type domain-containing protein n=1 Tax=Neosartorya fischeri (strain ATCC 1020 / DSM 3700 / CBS 544.65 / FGSC A1164 / JCM 1740 / NRRL 181 / WB 181) TaxID=331117 RepID=A1DLK5_NEOFI|nr:uncharacterized protein NFIA_050180 [Aspergillus fischeri NRRL 181]EAW15676.1 hypothetical protein NFIA_050180 [Aspergillus fischeri NRRL 181]KAG2026070.1 hypothetical protein GB937_002215 [Aspergillus fischeri]